MRWKPHCRPRIVIYDDFRNAGLVFVATRILGLFGIGDATAASCPGVVACGAILMTVAHVRYLPERGDQQ